MKKIIIFATILILLFPNIAFAGPQSTSYELKDYGFGSATASTSSTSYGLFGVAGEVDNGALSGSSLYSIGAGLNFTLQASVSAAPTFTNTASNYDRLHFIIDNANSPSDTNFAIQISTDSSFATNVNYIQSDFTVGPSQVWQTYSAWGSSSGNYVTGLLSNTTYYIRVSAMQGNFTQSEWSQSASATTSDPSLTFSLDSNSITFSNLSPSNSYTDNAKTTTLTTTTNAYSGYTVYAKETQALTSPTGTISDYSSPNSAPTSWSGTGFGYTTSDNSLSGSGGLSRFASGTKYAGFTTSASTPGDPVADNPGPVTNPIINNESYTVTYRVTGDSLTKAGTYSNTILYTIVAVY